MEVKLAIIYTRQSSSKKSIPQSESLRKAKTEHARFLMSMGISAPKSRKKRLNNPDNMPSNVLRSNNIPLSNTIPQNGFKKSIDDYKWKRGFDEKKEVIAETERKKKRVAPYTNKGAYMFVTDADDAKSLGKKV